MAERQPLVVLDAMGVLYDVGPGGDDVANLLIPYLRGLGCSLVDKQIYDLHHRASLGEMTSYEFWAACSVVRSDQIYCSYHELTQGIVPWLVGLRDRGLALACLSNDVSEWSLLLRRRFGLDGIIDTWVISGDIGVRKPDPRAFAAVGEATGVPAQDTIFIDDRPANVDAARATGMRAVRFESVQQARTLLDVEPGSSMGHRAAQDPAGF